jgi:hypothetical protein
MLSLSKFLVPIRLDGTYVVLKSIDIDGLSLTPTKTGLLPEIMRKFELLRSGLVTWLIGRLFDEL